MSHQEPSQVQTASKLLWSDPDFAKRYKMAEALTGQYAEDLVRQMAVQSYDQPIHFIDVACGTGVVTKKATELLQRSSNSKRPGPEDRFTCADMSPEMLKVLQSRVPVESWPVSEETKTLKTVIADMMDTKLPSDTYTHLGCNFGPGMANPDKVLSESFRMLRSGGIAGWTQWQSIGWMPDMAQAINDLRTAASKKCANDEASEEDQKLSCLPPMLTEEVMINQMAGANQAKKTDETVSYAETPRWTDEDYWKSRIKAAGFTDIQINVIQKPFSFTFEETINFLVPAVNIIRTFWTEADRKNLEGVNLQEKVREWFQKRFEEPDITDGKLTWQGFVAMVMTAKKA